ncbi:probable 4-coumarate--CoA ligase 3 [Anopheles arabiensis]|uniref:AMP-dependent synthetase/ligase domain-containing protein n=1 Tax=Anopheles arabiensis TaxID=7173 RepID=A0A182HIF2_ANOAR|nr:probable 4-coumarate--CoA ligase 3 [Anopheles arabiensis]
MATQYDPAAGCWRGPDRPPVLNPAANLGQVLLNVLERAGPKPAQLNADTGYAMSGDELRRRAVRFARRLIGPDRCQQGDVVALMARNSDDVAPVVLGCFLAGVTVSTLDPSFGVEEVEHLLRLTRPRNVIADADALPVVYEAAGRIGLLLAAQPYVLLGEPSAQCLPVADVTAVETDDEDGFVPVYRGDSTTLTAVIVCSSGTTGLPKAVRISHAQLIGPYQRISQLDRGDTILCFSTLYWISGWQMLMTGLLNGIRRVITTRPATAQLAIELCNRHQVTLLLVTPTMATDIVRTLEASAERLPSIKLFAVGGSTVSKRLREDINQRVLEAGRGRSLVGYGTSETGNIAYELLVRDDSVGFLLPGVTAKITAEDGRPLGPNETGELLVRPAHPFLGYHGDVPATEATLAADGYVRTGDIARFDADGYLYLVDRMREIFKYDGFQIAPAELEDTIAELPGVRYVAVVGLPDPARPYNELATALVVREPYESAGAPTERQVVDHCARTPDGRARPAHKWLRGSVIFVDQLPMTASGKVRRAAAKQLAASRWNPNGPHSSG